MVILPPFSSRLSGAHASVEGAFPESARTGLLHLLYEVVERQYVDGWHVIARELQRLARLPPTEYESSRTFGDKAAQADTEKILKSIKWQKLFDFCERLHNSLAKEVQESTQYGDHTVVERPEVQSYIAAELQRLFSEEGFAYEFFEGAVHRKGRKHTTEVSTRAQVVLGSSQLISARQHFIKALKFFRNPVEPDFENAVKEAVCAVEAAGKALFPEAKASTLGDLTKWLSNATNTLDIPKGIVATITGVYAFRSGGNGIGHGGGNGGAATAQIAEYVLALCASQIIFFVDLASIDDTDIPF